MNRKADVSSLRAGEIVCALGGAALLSWRGRRGLPVIRWLSLGTGASAIALAYAQATRRAPALPVALSVIVTALGTATAAGLLSRMLVSGARPSYPAPAGYFGLLAALTVAGGGFASMREESGTDPAELGELETITLES